MKSIWREDTFVGKNPLRFFLFVSKRHWKPAVLAAILAFTATALSTSVSYIFKLIADAALRLPAETAYHELLVAAGIYILVLALAKGFWRASGFAGAHWALGNLATSRDVLTSYVTLHSRSYFSNRFGGSLAHKISHASNGVRQMVDQFLWQFLELAVTVSVSLGILFLVNAKLALIFIVWVIAVTTVNVIMVRKRIPLTEYSHRLETGLNGMTVDLMTNISAMHEYARRGFELGRLRDAILTRRRAGMRNWYFGEWIRIANSLLLIFFGGAMVFTTVWFARLGLVSIGDIILVLTVVFRIEGALQALGSHLNQLAETWGEVKESLEEIIAPHEIVDVAHASTLVVPEGRITLSDVTFSYDGVAMFESLNLSIEPGQRVGIVGRSGAGKSTLMRILLRHHDLESGAILIDGTDIASVTQESLRSAIAIVPQEPLLFHRSIRENISYGNPHSSFDDIKEAARLAEANVFIERLAEGYESLVGERGVKLSGGERQRIVVARAILKNAPILILDEATSSLDSESEVAIQRALRTLMKGKTVLAIAHRLSTLREMDRLIVLDRGQIVEDGTHDSLIKKGGIYAELWNHQAGGFLQDEA